MTAQTINANLAECLVTKTHWGYDEIINICVGKTVVVEWVPLDYAGFVLMSVFLITLVVWFVAIVGYLIAALHEDYLS